MELLKTGSKWSSDLKILNLKISLDKMENIKTNLFRCSYRSYFFQIWTFWPKIAIKFESKWSSRAGCRLVGCWKPKLKNHFLGILAQNGLLGLVGCQSYDIYANSNFQFSIKDPIYLTLKVEKNAITQLNYVILT